MVRKRKMLQIQDFTQSSIESWTLSDEEEEPALRPTHLRIVQNERAHDVMFALFHAIIHHEILPVLISRLVVQRPVLVTLPSSALVRSRRHDDDARLLLPRHAPEVGKRSVKWSCEGVRELACLPTNSQFQFIYIH